MYQGVIFLIVICSVNGFNIKTSPVKNFTNDDPLFGQTVINSTDGDFVAFPTTGRLFKCTQKNACGLINSHVSNLNATYNSNSNNNHGGQINEGVKERMKRDDQKITGIKADEDDDAGTEIAFVLDGSGSIQPEDFQRAKDFIYKVMLNVSNRCFTCDFAIVQYGEDIRTELSLLDNKDGAKALEKVKEIKQLNRFTKTASAIHHVLTSVFVPENGSKPNSRKMIIVLSDGEILGDPMNLTDVLNMPQMKGITRFAIGVGDKLKPEAVQEMKEIADTDKFFHVSNYAALDDILSHLAQNITRSAGKERLPPIRIYRGCLSECTHCSLP